MEILPYSTLLDDAGMSGQVLHRDDVYCSGPPVDAVHGELLDYVLAKSGHKVLDIGCGIAPYVAELNRRGFDSMGVEIAPAYARTAAGLSRMVLTMDARSLAFRDGTFDTCLLIEVVEHIDEFERVLLEALRVARRNLIISVPNIDVIPYMSRHHVVPWHMLESTHVNFFTPAIMDTYLRRLFPQAKVEVESYSHFFPYETDRPLYFQIRALVQKPVAYSARGQLIRQP